MPVKANRLRETGRILRACLEGDGSGPPEGIAELVRGRPLDGLVEAAEHHRVVPWVHKALHGQEGVDVAVQRRLAARHRAGVRAHLGILLVLHKVRQALDGDGITWLAVKGPVLSEVLYPSPDLRLYADLDLVVAHDQLAGALDALAGAGCTVLDHNWPLIRREGHGELHAAAPGGEAIDVHWHLLFSRELRRRFPIPMRDLVERREVVGIRGRDTATLDPTDTLIHLALHAAIGGGADRLIWLKDVERSIVARPPDWDELVARARAWRSNLVVGLLLARAASQVGAPVPPGVPEALVPSRLWRWGTGEVDRLFPVARSVGASSPASLLARSTGATTGESARRAAALVARRARHVAATGSWHEPDTVSDPADPASSRHRAGGAAERAAYFADVAAEGAAGTR